MKTLTLNPITYVIAIVFNPIPWLNRIIELAVQKVFIYKQQNALSLTGFAACIFMFVILVLRLDAMLFFMYSQRCYRKKSSTLKEGTELTDE